MTDPNEAVTVLVPVSPIPAHPSTHVLDATLSSVREHLPTAEIIVMADGVRAEQEHREDDYRTFVDQVCQDTMDGRWGNAWVRQWRHHQHQARMTREVLDGKVGTPLILFVEGDTGLCGTIDLPRICAVLLSDAARVCRLHHEASVLAPHEWLNVNGGQVEQIDAVPLIATAQWSQRPHIARADYYRWLLGPRFMHPESRSMIEDAVWGRIVEDWRDRGRAGWDEHRLYIYAEPDGNGSIKHSTTLDGRQDDPKYPMNLLPAPGGGTFAEFRGDPA